MTVFAHPSPTNAQEEYLSRTLANQSLIDFITYTYPRYITDVFHIKVCEILQNAIDGNLRRIMIFAPPQHGKSEIVSVRFPAYWLGHNPDKPVIICSYGALLAMSKQSQSRRIIFSRQYRNIFPNLFKNEEYETNPRDYMKVMGSRITSAGVGGSITGFGAGLGIIDDPVKNYEEASSLGKRDRAWQWYQTTFRTRIWEHGVIVLIMTRWHEDDLAGRLLNQQGERWNVFRFPAIAETQDTRNMIADAQGQLMDQPDPIARLAGQPLAPLRFSRHELLNTQEEIGPLAWASEYQGFPQSPGGNMFKEEWFEVLENRLTKPIKRLRYWDKAATQGGGARSAGVLMSTDGKIFYIEDVVKGQWSTYQREQVIKQVAEQDEEMYGTVEIWLEQEGGSGGIDSAHMSISNLAGFTVHTEHPYKAKEVRAQPLASQAEAGHVKLIRGPWNRSFLDEMLMFPNSTYKDQVDSAAAGFMKLVRRGWARGASS